jgi:pimeloyl-ACP methyl ester carboxylesterase
MNDQVAVLLHGWPVTSYHWRHLQPRLDDGGLRTLVWSPPGLGVPPAPGTRFDKRAIAASLGEWLDANDAKEAVLVGHDWGGTIAWMLAAERPDLVSALVIEEEILPGIDAAIPEPGASVYPCWHGPFNRAVGLAEALVPGREDAYFGQFLKESAGPSGLERDAFDEYVAAYRPAHALGVSLAYYRTRAQDVHDVIELRRACPAMPVLAIGGRFGMGEAVAAGARQVSDDVRDIVLPLSGHYPAEQEPMEFSDAVLRFVSHSPARE